jgi:hypothetical protein
VREETASLRDRWLAVSDLLPVDDERGTPVGVELQIDPHLSSAIVPLRAEQDMTTRTRIDEALTRASEHPRVLVGQATAPRGVADLSGLRAIMPIHSSRNGAGPGPVRLPLGRGAGCLTDVATMQSGIRSVSRSGR